MKRYLIVAAALGLGGISVAGADVETERVRLGEGMVLSFDSNSGLRVRKGKMTARIHLDAESAEFAVSKKKRRVLIDYTDWCGLDGKQSFGYDQLLSRLENAAAYRLHRKKNWAEAAKGFARAAKLDPDFRIAATNLASALNLQGKQAEAVAALKPWIEKQPHSLYAKVVTDSELVSLLEKPELAALRAKKRGRARINRSKVSLGKLDLAYSRQLGLIAAIETESDWGGCGAYDTGLFVLDAKTGSQVAELSLVTFGDMTGEECSLTRRGKKRIAARVKAANRFLEDLGFDIPKGAERGTIPPDKPDDDRDEVDRPSRRRFKKARIGLVWSGGDGKVLRKNDTLGEGTFLENLSDAVYIKAANAVVVWTGRAGAEGCEGTDPTEVGVIPLKAR